jgi:hypothetical protein
MLNLIKSIKSVNSEIRIKAFCGDQDSTDIDNVVIDGVP